MTKTRVALFIDAENAPAAAADIYIERCRELGEPTILRCYGRAAALSGWEKPMMEHRMIPMLTPPSAKKANASDFALTIDAVSLLHRELFDHAVIASNDADFIQLVMHIRESGKGIEIMLAPKKTAAETVPAQKKAAVPAKPARARVAAAARKRTPAPEPEKPKIDSSNVLAIFREEERHKMPVTVERLGKALAMRMPGNYRRGHGTLTNYLKKSGVFEIVGGIVKLVNS